LSVFRKKRWSGLGFVNATLLRGAATMRSTIAGGRTYVSEARMAFGSQPCCTTFCAASGKALAAMTAATNRTRAGWGKRGIAYSVLGGKLSGLDGLIPGLDIRSGTAAC